MTTDKEIKSLEILKVEKMFIGVIDKKYDRRLFDKNKFIDQFNFYCGEHKELKEEILKLEHSNNNNKKDILINIRNEIADCVNTLEILYEIILRMEIKKG